MDIRELYQEVIMDHNRNPRNHHEMPAANCTAEGFNPLCGDRLTVYLCVDDQTIQDVSFVGCGCAISQASASLMTEAVKGKTIHAAHVLFEQVHALLTEETSNASDNSAPACDSVSMQKIQVLSNVRTYPMRVKCATLAWHTLEAALKQDANLVSTE